MSKVIEIRQKGDFKKSLTFFSHIKSWSVRPCEADECYFGA